MQKIVIGDKGSELEVVDNSSGKSYVLMIPPLTLGKTRQLSKVRLDLAALQKREAEIKKRLESVENSDEIQELEFETIEIENQYIEFLIEQLDFLVGPEHKQFSENMLIQDVATLVEKCVEIASVGKEDEKKRN